MLAQTAYIPAVIAAQIPELRAKHGPNLLYVEAAGGLVFMAITRGNLLRFEADAAIEPIWARIQLLRAHMVYPTDIAVLEQAISVQTLWAVADAVIKASGFYSNSLNAELNDMRLQVLERDHAIIRHICRAFPTISPLDINKMPKQDIIYLLAQAEMSLGITYDGIQLDEQAMDSLIAAKTARAKVQRSKTFDVDADQAGKDTVDYGDPEGDYTLRRDAHRRIRR